jgi:hypothetical protein
LFKAKKRKTKNQKLIQLSDLFLEKKSKVNDQRQDFLKKPPQSLTPPSKILNISYRLPKKVEIKQASFLK